MKTKKKAIKLISKLNKNLLETISIMEELNSSDIETSEKEALEKCAESLLESSANLSTVFLNSYKKSKSKHSTKKKTCNNDNKLIDNKKESILEDTTLKYDKTLANLKKAGNTKDATYADNIEFSELNVDNTIISETVVDYPIEGTLGLATVSILSNRKTIIKKDSLINISSKPGNKITATNFDRAEKRGDINVVYVEDKKYRILKSDITCGSIYDAMKMITGLSKVNTSMIRVGEQTLEEVLKIGKK